MRDITVHPTDVEAPQDVDQSILKIDDFGFRRACQAWLDDKGTDHMNKELKEK